jgi:hypothetical protein
MCAPRVTRHTSIRYSSPCHTRVNMGASIFFTAAMIRAFRLARSRGESGTYYVPPLPRDLPVLLARVIVAVKNIDAPMLTRVWQELVYRIVHTSNISNCQNFLIFPVAVNNSIKAGLLVFLL